MNDTNKTADIETMQSEATNKTIFCVRFFEDNQLEKFEMFDSYVLAEESARAWYKDFDKLETNFTKEI